MSGPVIRNPVPAWLRRENDSVFDTPIEEAIKMLARFLGADDPNSQVLGMLNPTEVAATPLAKAIEAVAGKLKTGIRAFHGSPHDFDQFSLSKIGTGEGAQAYGHGLYFAENEGVARQYRDTLTQDRVSAAKRALAASGGDVDSAIAESRAAIDRLKKLPNGGGDVGRQQRQIAIHEEKIAELNALKQSGGMSQGRMYEVNINADPEDFLDWDAPLSQQPQKARDVLTLPPQASRINETLKAKGHPEMTGGSAYTEIRAAGLPGPELSEKLKQQGIPGIKYFDQGSRAAGQGTRNYVVFDDKLISIVKKYGIAGALGAGLVNEAQARQLQEQGYQ